MESSSQFVWEAFASFCKQHPWLVAFNFAFLLLFPVESILLPRLYGSVITAIQSSDHANLLHAFVMLVATSIVTKAGNVAAEWHDAIVFPRLQSHVRQYMFALLLSRHDAGAEDAASGSLVARFGNIPRITTSVLERLQMVFIPNVMILIAASIYIAVTTDVVLGISIAALSIFVMFVVSTTPRLCKLSSTESARALVDVYDEIDDVFRNITSVHERQQYAAETARMREYEQDNTQATYRSMTCSLKVKAVLLPMVIMLLVLFGYRSYTAFQQDRLQVASFVVVFILIMQLLGALTVMADQMNDFTAAWGTLQAADHLFAQTHDKPDPAPQATGEAAPPSSPQGCIEARDVRYGYAGSRRPALDGVSFKVCPGERVAIVGSIGCGKTTMLKMLFKFITPQSGTLTWGDVDFKDIPTTLLRERVAMIPQTPVLFNRSIYENITYGHEGVSRERVMSMLRELGLEEVVMGREGGLDFVVGKNGSKLSGGQRQLIWCMRVMLGDPQLLLMDEPTASIDKKSKERLLRLLRHMMKDRTVVMVTHDDFLMKQATRVLHLCGTPPSP